jgi:hypothetical protein
MRVAAGAIHGSKYRLAMTLKVTRTGTAEHAEMEMGGLSEKEERSPDTEKPPVGNALSEEKVVPGSDDTVR